MTLRHLFPQSGIPSKGTRLSRHLLAVSLSSLLLVQPALGLTLAAEEPHDAVDKLPDAPLPESGGLTIEILDGEGALNNIRQRTAREPIVQVEDKNHKPVAGALVLFTINSGPSGASGSIAGATTFSVQTGPDGKAVLHGFKPNSVSGNFTITVTAALGALTAAAVLIHQKNETGAPGESNNSTSTGGAATPLAPSAGSPLAPSAGSPVAPSTGSPIAPPAGSSPTASANTPISPSEPGKAPVKVRHYLVQNSWGKTIAVAGGVVGAGVIVAIIALTEKTGGTTITAGAGGVGPP